ncbi:MAG: Gfo/Idh/MocA family oxidoreductase [Methanobacteriota archaeon]
MTRVGIIGVGKWGVNHLRSLHELRCDLVGIADVDPSKKQLATQFGVNFYQDYHELLNQVDAVTVTTPSDTHYEVVSECLHAGKHVLVEKPIAESVKQGKKLVELARSKEVVLSVGYLYRFSNAIRRTRELLPDLGNLEYITCRYMHSTKPPRQDSGVILNLGVHVIDMLNFITGEIPKTVTVKKQNMLSQKFEDSAFIMLQYKDFFTTIELSCMHPEKARDFWMIGEKQSLYVDFFNQKIRRYQLHVTHEKVDRKDPVVEPVTVNEPLKEELRYFIDFITKKDADAEENIGKENLYTTQLCELCLKSAMTGKEVKVT